MVPWVCRGTTGGGQILGLKGHGYAGGYSWVYEFRRTPQRKGRRKGSIHGSWWSNAVTGVVVWVCVGVDWGKGLREI